MTFPKCSRTCTGMIQRRIDSLDIPRAVAAISRTRKSGAFFGGVDSKVFKPRHHDYRPSRWVTSETGDKRERRSLNPRVDPSTRPVHALVAHRFDLSTAQAMERRSIANVTRMPQSKSHTSSWHKRACCPHPLMRNFHSNEKSGTDTAERVQSVPVWSTLSGVSCRVRFVTGVPRKGGWIKALTTRSPCLPGLWKPNDPSRVESLDTVVQIGEACNGWPGPNQQGNPSETSAAVRSHTTHASERDCPPLRINLAANGCPTKPQIELRPYCAQW